MNRFIIYVIVTVIILFAIAKFFESWDEQARWESGCRAAGGQPYQNGTVHECKDRNGNVISRWP